MQAAAVLMRRPAPDAIRGPWRQEWNAFLRKARRQPRREGRREKQRPVFLFCSFGIFFATGNVLLYQRLSAETLDSLSQERMQLRELFYYYYNLYLRTMLDTILW